MGRQKHNIESNCVTFDDYCYDETNYCDSIMAIDRKELGAIKKFFKGLLDLFRD